MKYFITLVFSLLFVHLQADELNWVNTQIEAIIPKRVGIDDNNISKVKSPFIFLSKNVSLDKKANSKKSTRYKYTHKKRTKRYTKKRLILDAIMNNSALINGKWYKLGQSVKNYKIISIENDSIVLSKNRKRITLSTVQKIKNLNFSR